MVGITWCNRFTNISIDSWARHKWSAGIYFINFISMILIYQNKTWKILDQSYQMESLYHSKSNQVETNQIKKQIKLIKRFILDSHHLGSLIDQCIIFRIKNFRFCCRWWERSWNSIRLFRGLLLSLITFVLSLSIGQHIRGWKIRVVVWFCWMFLYNKNIDK